MKTKDEEIAELKRMVKDMAAASGGKGGGKSGKPGKKGRGDSLPPALVPGVARTPDGTPICFAWNLGGCDKAKAGQRCDRGMHVCTKIGCQGNHSAANCRR